MVSSRPGHPGHLRLQVRRWLCRFDRTWGVCACFLCVCVCMRTWAPPVHISEKIHCDSMQLCPVVTADFSGRSHCSLDADGADAEKGAAGVGSLDAGLETTRELLQIQMYAGKCGLDTAGRTSCSFSVTFSWPLSVWKNSGFFVVFRGHRCGQILRVLALKSLLNIPAGQNPAGIHTWACQAWGMLYRPGSSHVVSASVKGLLEHHRHGPLAPGANPLPNPLLATCFEEGWRAHRLVFRLVLKSYATFLPSLGESLSLSSLQWKLQEVCAHKIAVSVQVTSHRTCSVHRTRREALFAHPCANPFPLAVQASQWLGALDLTNSPLLERFEVGTDSSARRGGGMLAAQKYNEPGTGIPWAGCRPQDGGTIPSWTLGPWLGDRQVQARALILAEPSKLLQPCRGNTQLILVNVCLRWMQQLQPLLRKLLGKGSTRPPNPMQPQHEYIYIYML